jgi:hypothetical protein
MCPECGVELVACEVRGRSPGNVLLGELLIFAGIMALFINVVVTLLLTVAGALLMCVGNWRPQLICPHCGSSCTTRREPASRHG